MARLVAPNNFLSYFDLHVDIREEVNGRLNKTITNLKAKRTI